LVANCIEDILDATIVCHNPFQEGQNKNVSDGRAVPESGTARLKWVAPGVDFMYDSVLLPTDGSDGAAEALEHAIGVATAFDADLHIISIIDRRVVLAADTDEKEAVRSELSDDATEAVEGLANRAAEAGIEATTATTEGVPHREILAYAADNDLDLLVLGTHGRTGREKRLHLGSTTERVVKESERPVTVVNIG
jgi:nucleotide-binding universal stress UspA family protein